MAEHQARDSAITAMARHEADTSGRRADLKEDEGEEEGEDYKTL